MSTKKQSIESTNEVNNNSNIEAMNQNVEMVATSNATTNEVNNNNKKQKRMKTLNFLSTVSSIEDGAIKVDTRFAKEIQDCLHSNSQSVEITIKNMDNMLGIRYSIFNICSFPIVGENGVDAELLDAIFAAMCGQMEALKAYDPTGRKVETGTELKHEILDQFLASPLPREVKTVNISNSTILEVSFQLGYLRKVKIYFGSKDAKVIEKLTSVGLLAA